MKVVVNLKESKVMKTCANHHGNMLSIMGNWRVI